MRSFIARPRLIVLRVDAGAELWTFQRGAMKITVNGSEVDVPDGLSVRGLIEHLGLTEGPVAVEQNREIVPRAEHMTRSVRAGDTLEIVHFVGGG
jgi:sulfur carrier protein